MNITKSDRDCLIEIATDAVAEIRELRRLLICSWTPTTYDQSIRLEEQVREILGTDFPESYDGVPPNYSGQSKTENIQNRT